MSVEIPYKIPKNVYECPRCHNRFLAFKKSLHDFHCTDQHPESLIDYQCPRCGNCFPSVNKILHDARCTSQPPLSLNIDITTKEVYECPNCHNYHYIYSNSNENQFQSKKDQRKFQVQNIINVKIVITK